LPTIPSMPSGTTHDPATLVLVLDFRFARTPDGVVWTDTTYDAAFWDRYLEIFSALRVVARVRDEARAEPHWRRVERAGVVVHAVPHYVGPVEYFKKRGVVRTAVAAAVSPGDAVMLRAPGQLSTVMAGVLRRRCQPWAVEVAGDPDASFGSGASAHPLRAIFRRAFTRQLRAQTLEAAAVLYVSRGLAAKYPPTSSADTVVCSDVFLPAEAFAIGPRAHMAQATARVITVGSLEQPVKGTSVLIDACAIARRSGLRVSLTIVGGGRLQVDLERQAHAAGLGDLVRFAGLLPSGEAVRAELNAADLFVLPSFTEGLPRALAEAMACALPCLGSDVGGIAELLAPEDTVSAGDAHALAAAMTAVMADPRRLDQMSERNLRVAREFSEAVLHPRRRDWYARVLARLVSRPRRASL